MNIKKSLIYSFSESYLIVIIQLGSSMVIARLLTPEEIGQFSIGIAILAIAHMLRDFGIGNYLIQEKELTKQKIKTAFGITLLIAWFLAVILFSSRYLIADLYNEGNIATILGWMSINFLIIPFSSPTLAIFRREMKFHLIFYINLISSIISAGTAIYLAKNNFSYMSLVWSSIANISTTALLVALFKPRETFILPSLKNSKEILTFGGISSLSNLISTLGQNSAELIIGKALGFSSVAILSKATTINNLFRDNFIGSISKVFLPLISEYNRKNIPLNTPYMIATSYISSLALPFYGLLAIYADLIIRLLFGEQWIESAELIRILSISGMIQSFYSFAPSTIYAINKPKSVLHCETINQSVKVTLMFIASFYSLKIIAWSFVVSNIIALCIYTSTLKKLINIKSLKVISKIIIPSILILITSTLIPFYIQYYIEFHTNNTISFIYGHALYALFSLLSWVSTLILLDYPIKHEIIKILKLN